MHFVHEWGSVTTNQTSTSVIDLDNYHFIVYFDIADFDCDSLIEFSCDFMINLCDSSWNNTSVFVFSAAPSHCKCFASTSLTIAHDCAIVPLDD